MFMRRQGDVAILDGPRLDLEERIISYVNQNGAIPVANLFEALQREGALLTDTELTNSILRLVGLGKFMVRDMPIQSLFDYLTCWIRNLWFYGSVAVSALAVILAYTVAANDFPYVILRWGFGAILVLSIPGYLTVAVIFPRYGDLQVVERLALSVLLSVALLAILGLLLNYTSWGLTFLPMLSSLAALSFALAVMALVSQYRAQLADSLT
jgi:hypothetical protein